MQARPNVIFLGIVSDTFERVIRNEAAEIPDYVTRVLEANDVCFKAAGQLGDIFPERQSSDLRTTDGVYDPKSRTVAIAEYPPGPEGQRYFRPTAAEHRFVLHHESGHALSAALGLDDSPGFLAAFNKDLEAHKGKSSISDRLDEYAPHLHASEVFADSAAVLGCMTSGSYGEACREVEDNWPNSVNWAAKIYLGIKDYCDSHPQQTGRELLRSLDKHLESVTHPAVVEPPQVVAQQTVTSPVIRLGNTM